MGLCLMKAFWVILLQFINSRLTWVLKAAKEDKKITAIDRHCLEAIFSQDEI